jgi:hypothetical protein
MFVRVGLAWGEGKKAFSGGRIGQDWGFYTSTQYDNIWDKLCNLLHSTPFGVYDGVASILGEETAKMLADTHGYKSRLYLAEADADVSEVGPSKKKRVRRL